jgi:hypothetical protein
LTTKIEVADGAFLFPCYLWMHNSKWRCYEQIWNFKSSSTTKTTTRNITITWLVEANDVKIFIYQPTEIGWLYRLFLKSSMCRSSAPTNKLFFGTWYQRKISKSTIQLFDSIIKLIIDSKLVFFNYVVRPA